MKHFILTTLSLAILVISALLVSLYFIMKADVRNNIELAEKIYGMHSEEALIVFLEDDKNSFHDRSHLAVWTLGKIRSQKALPVLNKYYLNDPEGRSCKGKHREKLCQYEIHKAIQAIEKGALLSYSVLR